MIFHCPESVIEVFAGLSIGSCRTEESRAMFEVASILITIAAVCSYINYKFIKMPTTIG